MADSPELQQVGQSTTEKTAISASNERTAVPLPAESEEHQEFRKILQLKEKTGWEIRFFDLQYERKMKFGLTIRNYEGCVMVSKLESKSLTAEKLLVGDHLFAVNSDIVTDREAAKNLIMKSFVKKKKVTLTIYRPYSSEAKLWAKTAILSTSTRTSSTAPCEKIKWAKMAAQQRQAAKLLAKQEQLKEAPTPSSTNISARHEPMN
uniref:PDZ domain-containing protein n=1 Tax=Panagrolaimus sp. JU765 TaxID=591449 RepID=A0AC34QNY3_9BILA